MSASKLSIKFLIRDKISTFYLVISTIICYTSLFILFNIAYLDGRESEGGVIGIIIFTATFISSYLFWYINNMSLEARRKEMAVETICGVTKGKVSMLSILQLLSMSGIAAIIGFILANIVAPILVRIIYSINGSVAPALSFSFESILVPIIIILIQFLFVLFNNAGMVYRCEPVNLFKKEKGIKLLSMSVTTVKMVVSLIFINYIGFLGVFYCGVLLYIEFALKNKMYNRRNFMILKFLKKSLDGSLFLIVGYIAVKFSSASLMLKDLSDPYILSLGIIGVAMMMIIVTIAFVYKIIFGVIENKKAYKTLTMIGYSKNEVKKMLEKEIGLFSLFILATPLSEIPILLIFGGGLDFYVLIYAGVHVVLTLIAIAVIFKVSNKLVSEYIK